MPAVVAANPSPGGAEPTAGWRPERPRWSAAVDEWAACRGSIGPPRLTGLCRHLPAVTAGGSVGLARRLSSRRGILVAGVAQHLPEQEKAVEGGQEGLGEKQGLRLLHAGGAAAHLGCAALEVRECWTQR